MCKEKKEIKMKSEPFSATKKSAPGVGGAFKVPMNTPSAPQNSVPEVLSYVHPWRAVYIVIPFFLLLNYLAFFAIHRTEEEAYWEVYPPYLERLEQFRLTVNRQGLWYDSPLTLLCVLVFYLEKGISVIAQFSSFIFVRKLIIWHLCSFCWAIHFYEVGITVRMCRNANATWSTTLRYALITIFSGVCQLSPLKEEYSAYTKREYRRRGRLPKKTD